jgi:agmatine/peptidylarginine deiminase
MPGDDTDGHIDTIVRIAPEHTLLYNKNIQLTEQLKGLRTLEGQPYRLLELPLPSPIYDEDGEQLPATYANFLILNGAVLVPTYNQPENDAEAISIIQSAFSDREMVPIDSRSIIKQHGSIHCCTMQYPK